MTSKLALAAVSLLALGLLAPVNAQAGTGGITNPNAPSATTLYFHVIDALNEAPINTQVPDDSFAKDAIVGLASNSNTCLDGPSGGAVSTSDFHQFFGYSSPGYVEYNDTSDGGPRTHPERGLSYDVALAGDAIKLTWYLSTGTALPNDPAGQMLILPAIAVEAWMRTGEDISIGNEGYKSGTQIAHGKTVGTMGGAMLTSTDTAAPGQTGGTVTFLPDQVDKSGRPTAVYQYEILMPLDTQSIKKDGGYNMQIATYFQDPASFCSSDPANAILTPNAIKIHTSKDNRPRMELQVLNAVRIEYMHPQFIGDDLVLHTSSNSPWGNYDVDEVATSGTNGVKGGIEMAITGPSEPRSAYRASVVQRYHEHDHHTEAVDVSFVWPYKTDGAQDGSYTVTLTVKNDQGTATAVGVSSFTVGKDRVVQRCGGLENVDGAKIDANGCTIEQQDGNGERIDPNATKKSPAFELLGMIAALGAVALTLRRRN
ncbi:MAG: hypothetical protein AABX89_02660 [Candidatus Thermoplasmatota archaeon]